MLNKNQIEFALLISFSKIVNLFKFESLPKVAKILTPLFYNVVKIRKEVILKNLKIAFPEKEEKFYLNTAKENYFHFILTLLEIIKIPSLTKEKLNAIFKVQNPGLLKEKISQNKGLIFLTAHFGNWELGAVAIGSQTDIAINVLTKPQRNNLVFKWLNDIRESFGNKSVKLGASVREIYKALKEKNVVGIVGDQRGPKEGMRVLFFGKETAVFPGTAAISLKTGSPILTAIAERKPDFTYELTLGEINPDEKEGSEEEKIRFINQKYMNILEDHIRKNPAQWFWMHNIWKY